MNAKTHRHIARGIFIALAFVLLGGCGGGGGDPLLAPLPQYTPREWGSEWDDWTDGWTQRKTAGRAASQEEEEDAFGNITETTFATINDVTYSAYPSGGTISSGRSVSVSANISLDDEAGEASIRLVKLIYRMNGSVRRAVNMADQGGGTWTGVIPGASAGTKVDFYIWVCDTNGNVSTGAFPSKDVFVSGVKDIDNSSDIVEDSADLLRFAASYDSENIYIGYETQGAIDGGTVEPPYMRMYMVKITNPDTEQGEGLMVGKQWMNMPLFKEQSVREKFMPMLLEQGKEYVDKIGRENIDRVLETGFFVLDIQKLMGGNIMEGMLFSAYPEGYTYNNIFVGRLKRAALGENPSGYFRILVLTAANASLDSFMPIPINCANFLTLYTSSYSYTVQ